MAAKTPFTAPVVDALTVRVLVDSRYERFLPRMSHPHVKIEHVGRITGRPESTFACEWGLSLHLMSEKDGAKAQYVLDFGYTPEIINRNFELLGIEPGKINGLILSHGHLDHFGGLQGFVKQHRAQMREDIALYVGGETVFRTKWVKEGGETLEWCTLDRAALEAQKVMPMCCPTPQALEGPFTSGYIERSSFETVTGGSLVVDDHFTEAEREGKLVKDTHPDEHATCYIVKGKGLVVIAVNVGESRKKVEQYLQKYPRACKTVLAAETNLAAVFRAKGVPFYVVLAPDGGVAATQLGSGGESALRQLLSKAGL